jgi:hypothetical protein
MPHSAGFTIPLSPQRRILLDYLHFASASRSAAAERRMDLFRLAAARSQASPRPGWAAIFTKAWALACKAHPALRRSFLASPWPRLYQHPESTALLAVERLHGGEPELAFLPLARPDQLSLLEIDRRIQWFRDRPAEGCGALRRQARVSRWPALVRRAAWWAALNFSGRARARIFGTFGVSACCGLGAETVQAATLQTTSLHPGVVGPGGQATVRVTYDARAVDGPAIARALDDLERILRNDLLAELRYLPALAAA